MPGTARTTAERLTNSNCCGLANLHNNVASSVFYYTEDDPFSPRCACANKRVHTADISRTALI